MACRGWAGESLAKLGGVPPQNNCGGKVVGALAMIKELTVAGRITRSRVQNPCEPPTTIALWWLAPNIAGAGLVNPINNRADSGPGGL